MKSSTRTLRARFAAGAVMIAQLAGAAIAQPMSRPARGDSFRQDYANLAQHNIFVKDRIGQLVARGGPLQSRFSAQQGLVVTGIVSRDQQQYVVVENVLDGSVQQLHPGDRIADGTVIGIAIDSMSYAPDNRGGGTISVPTAANLTGMVVESMTDARRRLLIRGDSVSLPTQSALESGNVNPGKLSGVEERN